MAHVVPATVAGMPRRARHLCYPRWRSLGNAFMSWLAGQDQVIQSEIVATKRRGRVRLAFTRFPTLSGWVERNCLAVYAADNEGEYQILDFDCLPIRIADPQTFICGFCEGEKRAFDGREALWRDHLFEPFGVWVRTELHPRNEHRVSSGWRPNWGRLRPPSSRHPCLDDGMIKYDEAVDHMRVYRLARKPRRPP